jgi:FAD/FMN-containing dehydrogenase/alpha-beta hydrolase superfamily lysophospholipase
MTEQIEVHDARRRLLDGLPVTERRLVVDGVRTTVLEGGEGRPVVLLHGPGGNAAHWMTVIPQLAACHRVIVPDLPGHGSSEVGGDRVLEWLGDLISQCCASAPVLVGNAVGGTIAARFACEHGDRLSRLVLVDTLGLVAFDPAPEFGAALGAFMAEPTARTHDDLWRYCAFDLDGLRERMGESWEAFAAYNVDRARTPGVIAAVGSVMHQFAAVPVAAADLARIAVPTSLIWGRHDLATPLAVAEAASARYGWPLHVVEGAADIPPLEQPEAFLDALRSALVTVLRPDDAGFDEATSLWNGMIDKTPALVVRPTGAADVAWAVRHARGHDLALSVRGGGHNIAGTALVDGGLTIDMSRLRTVDVDPVARTATVGAGCLLEDVDREAQLHGLATPLGFFSEVGVAGLTLGGGLGYLTRRFGWAVDNLLAVEIVTADGEIRRASRDEHADLFWAIRGAGANLGAVTSFTFAMHEVGPTVYGGLIAWPFDRAEEVLRTYRDLTSGAPRELTVFLLLVRAPAAPFVPPAWHGKRVCAMSVCFSGDRDAVEPTLAPIRALGDPVIDLLREQPYVELQSYLNETEPKGDHYYWRTEFLAGLSDGLLTTCRETFAESPIPDAEVGLLHIGGALNDREPDDGAVGNRDAHYVFGVLGMWPPDEPRADAFRQWVRDAGERGRPFSTGASYINFQTADEGEDRVRATYGANFDRMAAIKAKYDPDNVFRSNRNVRPATA